jgi:hypothetical protein
MDAAGEKSGAGSGGNGQRPCWLYLVSWLGSLLGCEIVVPQWMQEEANRLPIDGKGVAEVEV